MQNFNCFPRVTHVPQSVEVGTTSIKVPVVERSIPGWKLVCPEHWLGTALVPPLTHSLFDNTELTPFTGHVGHLSSGVLFFTKKFCQCILTFKRPLVQWSAFQNL